MEITRPSNSMIDLNLHNVFEPLSRCVRAAHRPLDSPAMSRRKTCPPLKRLLKVGAGREPEVYVEFRVRRSNGDGDGVVWLACKGATHHG